MWAVGVQVLGSFFLTHANIPPGTQLRNKGAAHAGRIGLPLEGGG